MLNDFLVAKLRMRIQKNPYTQVHTFALLPFRVNPGYHVPPFASQPNDEEHGLDTKPFDSDDPESYTFVPSLEDYDPKDQSIYYFALGGNHCRAAWHEVLRTSNLECPLQTGHVYPGLDQSLAQFVSFVCCFFKLLVLWSLHAY